MARVPRFGGGLGPPVTRLLAAAAIYGSSVGAVRSWRFAALNLVKFPLLIGLSVVVCAGVYFLVARILAPAMRFSDVARLVLGVYADIASLLASLAPVTLFLALTLRPPASTIDLGEYPAFLGGNVALIAACGVLAVRTQARALVAAHGLGRGRALAIVAGWLAVSLFVGGQAAWYLRPFFGNRAVPDDGSFCHGTRPDFRGATSFYEAVLHIVAPPAHREGTPRP